MFSPKENGGGYCLSVFGIGVFLVERRVRAVCISKAEGMTHFQVICGLSAILLLVYLLAAILKPEWF